MKSMPKDFVIALKAAGLDHFFVACTNAHQNQYLKSIGEAMRPETRPAQITKAVQMLSDKCADEKARAKKK